MLDLSKDELKQFKKINTPNKIQDYLDSIPFNFEIDGETCMSPRRVLRTKKANCIEGAMLAATALWIQGEAPLIVSLKVEKGDFDHAITLYKKNGFWGAISKTNHSVLRFRDPVYKTVRELVMSYFHEYFLVSTGKKTLKGYSRPVNMKKFGKKWVTEERDLWEIGEEIYYRPIIKIVPKINKKYLRTASHTERTSASIPEWKRGK